MVDNYKIIKETVQKMIKKLYKAINDYLENIFHSPSTINRLIKYYQVGYCPSEPNKRYIYFNGKCIREFEIVLPDWDLIPSYMLRSNLE